DDADIELAGIRIRNNKRELFKLKMEVSQAIYENERCIQIIIRDQSSSKDVEKLKREMARKDQLTELYNRQYFIKLLTRALDDAAKSQTRSVLLYLAMDNYNTIRDQVGIGGSDPILVSIANVLRQEMGEDASIARFGDSVFTLLVKGVDIDAATAVGDKLRKAIEANVVELDNHQQFVVTCSIGVALVLAAAGKPQTVLSDAHAACQRAHQQGGNQVEVYKAEVVTTGAGTQDFDSVNLGKVIETAIEEKRLSLAYQAILGLQDEAREMYDVFLRMVDAEGNPIPAGKIFAAAEQANLSITLDKWVLKEAVGILTKRKQQGRDTCFFIKLSDQAVRDESLLLYINRLLRATQLPGDSLTIEISESTAISQIKYAKAFVTHLQKMRCKSALEHFGTGLNSDTTLKHLPVDYVKIDSSYARGLSSNTENQGAVKNIIEMAHSHDKLAIAEAVEDANSLAVLFSCGADFAQGHYIHEPSENMDYDFSDN
ncbi:MAG: EAL domain-containing protein, partial [Pseudomonadota bacterium]